MKIEWLAPVTVTDQSAGAGQAGLTSPQSAPKSTVPRLPSISSPEANEAQAASILNEPPFHPSPNESIITIVYEAPSTKQTSVE